VRRNRRDLDELSCCVFAPLLEERRMLRVDSALRGP
jgi:hypothetical protein